MCNAPPDVSQYSLSMHIAAMFILLVLSALGVFGATIVSRRSQSHQHRTLAHVLMDLGKHFGSGIILATGFIHMLPPAIQSLTSPCLQMSGLYGSWATLYALFAGLTINLIEFIAGERSRQNAIVMTVDAGPDTVNVQHHGDVVIGSVMDTQSATILVGRSRANTTASKECHDCHDEQLVAMPVDTKCEVQQMSNIPVHHHAGHHCHDPSSILLLSPDASYRRKIATYILEVGIALHSIIIGLTLGVTPTAELVPLLIALSFHQFFEGVALGSRIGELGGGWWKASSMAMVFALTTPIGTLIGILVRSMYSDTNTNVMLIQGTLDAVAAGILIYVGWVHMIAGEVAHNNDFSSLRRWERIAAFVAIWLGAGVMALIGNWA